MTIHLGIYDTATGPLILDATARGARGIVASTNEHGFERLTATIAMPLAEAYQLYQYSALPWVRLRSNGQTIWEGRLSDPELFVEEDAAGVTIEAFGAWDALSDIPYTALWSDTRVDQWFVLTSQMSANEFNARFTFTQDDNALTIAANNGALMGATPANIVGRLGFVLPSQSSRLITNISFDFDHDVQSGTWLTGVQEATAPEPINGAWTFHANAFLRTSAFSFASSVCVSFSTPRNATTLFLLKSGATAANPDQTEQNRILITNLRITTAPLLVDTTTTASVGVGATSMTVTSAANITVGMELFLLDGIALSGERVTVTSVSGTTIGITATTGSYTTGARVRAQRVIATDIVSDLASVVSGTNIGQLDASTALLNPDAITLPDLDDEVYEDADMKSIINRLILLGDSSNNRLEAGVWEDRRLFLYRRGARSRAWFADAATFTLRRSSDSLANSVYGVYQDASGRTLRTATATNSQSVTSFGYTRRRTASVDTTSQAEAERIRDTTLVDGATPQPQARFTIRLLQSGDGAIWPLWMLRANDTMTVRGIPSAFGTGVDRLRTFRITRTEYDVDNNVMSFEPEEPLPTLEVLLAQQAAGLVGQAITPIEKPVRIK